MNIRLFTALLTLFYLLSSYTFSWSPFSDNYGKYEDPFHALHDATYRKDIQEIKRLVEHGAYINARARGGGEGITPLHVAVIFTRNEDIVQFFIQNGAKINTHGYGETPLHSAVRYNKYNTAQLLIDNGADVNAPDRANRTPLKLALEENRPDLEKLLRLHGARETTEASYQDQEPRFCHEDDNPLHYAIERNDLPEVQRLLKQGADINDRAGTGYEAPLAVAVRSEHYNFPMIQFLVDNGADVNNNPGYKHTFLHEAVMRQHSGIVTILLNNGANVNAQYAGFTSLHIATAMGNDALVKALIEHGANVNLVTDEGESPLYFAVRENHYEIVLYLLDHGADINACTNRLGKRESILDSVEGPWMRELLLEHGARSASELFAE